MTNSVNEHVEQLVDHDGFTSVLGNAAITIGKQLARVCVESNPIVILATALTVRALQAGSVCIQPGRIQTELADLLQLEAAIDFDELPWPSPEQFHRALTTSTMVATGDQLPGHTPLRLVGDRLYLEKYWQTEVRIRDRVINRLTDRDSLGLQLQQAKQQLDLLFDSDQLPTGEIDRQRQAAATSIVSPITVIAGGPGTGKTTTLAKILALHLSLNPQLNFAFAAPTGKAARRISEAVADSFASLDSSFAKFESIFTSVSATTIHRLLGINPGTGRPKFSEKDQLTHDLIIIDEVSMVSLRQMDLVLAALGPRTRIVLVGDPNQLASVEAGAVLADLIHAPLAPPRPEITKDIAQLVPNLEAKAVDPVRIQLTHTFRFGKNIAEFSKAVISGDIATVQELIHRDLPEIEFHHIDDAVALTAHNTGSLSRTVRDQTEAIEAAARSADAAAALRALNHHRILVGHHGGARGNWRVSHLVRQWQADMRAASGSVEDLFTRPDLTGGKMSSAEGWYPGRPVLITRNDPLTGLNNGDTAVAILVDGQLRAAVGRGNHVELYSPMQLDSAETLLAMTVHKSQGSQFDEVTIVLPPADSPLLTRELLYTAITRAQHKIRLIGSEDALLAATQQRTLRVSGLRN